MVMLLFLNSNYDLKFCFNFSVYTGYLLECLSSQILLLRRRLCCWSVLSTYHRCYSYSGFSILASLGAGCSSVFVLAWGTFLFTAVNPQDYPCISQLAPCWPCSVLGRGFSALRWVSRFLCNTGVSVSPSIWQLTMVQRYTLPILSIAYLARVSLLCPFTAGASCGGLRNFSRRRHLWNSWQSCRSSCQSWVGNCNS